MSEISEIYQDVPFRTREDLDRYAVRRNAAR